MLDRANVVFIQGGVSISLAALAPDRRPSMSRGMGCKVIDGGRQVVIFVKRSQSADLLEGIASNGRVANVFSLPSSHRTLQLKGSDARVRPFDASDLKVIEAHVADFVRQVVPLGMREDMVRALFACTADDLSSVLYTPCAAYSQTPGPKAGESLAGAP